MIIRNAIKCKICGDIIESFLFMTIKFVLVALVQ